MLHPPLLSQYSLPLQPPSMQLLHPCSPHPRSFSTLQPPSMQLPYPCSPHPCSFTTLAALLHRAAFLKPLTSSLLLTHPLSFTARALRTYPWPPCPSLSPPTSPQPSFSQRRHKQNPVIATDRGSPEQGARGDRGIARCSIVRECRSRHSLAVFARYCRKAHQIRRIDAAV